MSRMYKAPTLSKTHTLPFYLETESLNENVSIYSKKYRILYAKSL